MVWCALYLCLSKGYAVKGVRYQHLTTGCRLRYAQSKLTGAAKVGMYPILKRINLMDVYDPDRNDVQNWRGPEVERISDLVGILNSLQKQKGTGTRLILVFL